VVWIAQVTWLAVISSPDSAGTSMGAPQEAVEAALTDRYQTTVPQPVRRALGLHKRDRIRFAFRANGEVVLQRVSPDSGKEDPALAPFLALLEQDIASHPERLQPIGADLVQHLQDLVGAIEVDLDEALPDDEPA
jgi:antitoxin PrlF